MGEMTKQERVYGIFQSISEGYDKANSRISLGMQSGWKRLLTGRLVKELPRGGALLDVCCGTGDIVLDVTAKRSDIQGVGLDFSPAMLAVAKEKGRDRKNTAFQQGDAMALPFERGRFDGACISFGLRNTADYERVLRELCRVTKKGGLVCCLDSFVPENRLIQPFYRLYFQYLMPLLGGGKKHAREYQWLYRSTQDFLRPSQLEELFREVGLKDVQRKSRLFGACVFLWGHKGSMICT